MPLKSDLMSSSLPWEAAGKLGFDVLQNITAAGTTAGTATALGCNFANVTTSTIGAGVILTEQSTTGYIYNSGPNTLTVYPLTGSNFVGLGANVGLNVATGSALTYAGGGTNVAFNISI